MIPLLTSPAQIQFVECDRARRAGGDYYTIAGSTWIGATSLFPRYLDTETAAGYQPSKSQLQSVQQTARWAELLHEHCGC